MQKNQPFTTRTQEASKKVHFTSKRRETKRDLQFKKQTKTKGREQENECEVDRNKSNKLDFDHLYRPQQDDVRNLLTIAKIHINKIIFLVSYFIL